jgi:hypothetical protein
MRWPHTTIKSRFPQFSTVPGLRLLAVLALLVPVGLAGCAGDEGGAGGAATEEQCDLEPVLCDPEHYLATHHCITSGTRPRVYAPDTPGPDTAADPWKPGDYWTYRLTIDGRSHETTLVYYDDIDIDPAGRAQHYLVGTPSAAEAQEHALHSVNPMLGRIHRTLYSPHESGLHADMFNFPLCEASVWTTEFYGTTFDLVATRTTLTLPDGRTDPLGFTMRGTSGDGSTLTHTYSPLAKWFTRIDIDRADGLKVDMELLASGSGKSGQYHFLRAQKDEVLDLGAIGSTPAIVNREDGGEGPYTTVGIATAATREGSGKVEILLRDPSGAVRACTGFAGQGVGGGLRAGCVEGGRLETQVPYQAGDWTVAVERPLLDQSTRVRGEMILVSIYDRSGTV